jgi:ABC-2 type transport system permease protein
LQSILQPVPVLTKGLAKRNPETGELQDAADENPFLSIGVPGGLMLLMFMLILLGATPLLQGVVEEKMQRIAEVLLGSVRPFQLMMGKLLGMVAVSLTLAAVYLTGAYWAAHRYHFAEYVATEMIVWFVVYQSLAVLMFGSLMIAVGAACTDMRETQSMMWPVMLLICLPMFVWINVIKEPNSSFSTAISLFPFATPMLMLGRQAVPPGIPWWQPALGICLVLLTTLLCVYAAGRIFRVGILMQGKGARVGEVFRWVFRG